MDVLRIFKIRVYCAYAGLYFSAHWCPPCRAFTPMLGEFYNNLKAAGKSLEIVFVSSDRDEAQWKEYYHSMPWLALPFEDRKRKVLYYSACPLHACFFLTNS